MPRPLSYEQLVGKGGTAGFLGRAFDPYTLYPPGDDMDMKKMDSIRRTTFSYGRSVGRRLGRRGKLHDHRRRDA